jgi:hypothetical protein
MANPRRGEVELDIGGETFSLVFDWNAISDIESKFGDRPVAELFKSDSGAVPARVLREALRVGLDKRNRKRTSNEVGAMIADAVQKDPEAYERIVKAVVEGVFGAFGVTGQKAEGATKDGAEKPRPPEASAASPAIGGA